MQTITNQTMFNGTNAVLAPPMAAAHTCPSTLDAVYDEIRTGRLAPALDELFDDLLARRREAPAEWPAYGRECLNHPLRELLHQDPFTYRAFSKPRGYAGDAVMMDYIYGTGEAVTAAQEATALGRAIFEYMGSRPSASAVRYRRRLLADLIDRAAKRPDASVLAIAAGHLREVELSAAVQSGAVREFVALDQDENSLAVVDCDYTRVGIRTMPGSVRQILAGKLDPGKYDLVYAAGLFDYLSAPVAAAFARRMFDMVRPGGTMLIPNFVTGTRDTGYMESFMDWHLIYRNEADMRAMSAALPQDEVGGAQVFEDDVNTITYLLVSKAR
jgi:extracellular factor (EF) 3-hydroxypalmitic acid methyl ester biosynthesis protein